MNAYLATHGLENDWVPVEAVLLQCAGTRGGRAAVLVVAMVGGRKVVIKTSFNLWSMALHGMRGALAKLGLLEREG